VTIEKNPSFVASYAFLSTSEDIGFYSDANLAIQTREEKYNPTSEIQCYGHRNKGNEHNTNA
jgi:hypothetical protein